MTNIESSAVATATPTNLGNLYGISDPEHANLSALTQQQVVCFITQSTNNYNGQLGARVSAIFVIGIVSSFATFFPVVAKRVPGFHIPLYVYLFARYFGAGVIVATAFIHLLDPAYGEIGQSTPSRPRIHSLTSIRPDTCVGLTGSWAVYSWPPAIVLASVMGIFVMDFVAERYVETKYGIGTEQDIQGAVTGRSESQDLTAQRTTSGAMNRSRSMAEGANGEHDPRRHSAAMIEAEAEKNYAKKFVEASYETNNAEEEEARKFAVQQQLAAFLILEFGVIFHSVIIGLNLGVAGDEFSTLYPVLVFHQSFEGLGIGARMSAIPFRKGSWLPWALCSAYGLTTPIAIAIGLGVRTTYNSGSFTANVVSGVLDSLSAGILIYTGLVELLARDFLFNPLRTKDNKRLAFMMICVFLGAGLMALLGK